VEKLVSERVIAGLALLALAAQLAVGLRGDGLTIDEVVYIASGYRHLTALDFRSNPEQPPLAKMWGALPLLALPIQMPAWRPGDQWGWSYRFVHQDNAAGRVIAWARLPTVVLTLALAVALWSWARSSRGPAAGLIALVLAAFHTSLVAHGHLITTDVPGAFTMLLASWAFWRWSETPGPRRAVVVGLALGVAVTTRLTGWLLVPAFVILAFGRLVRAPREERRHRLAPALTLAAVLFVVVPAVIWAAYGFRYAAWPGETFAQAPGPWMGRTGRVIAAMQAARVLPEAYLEGARLVAEHNIIGHPTYLLGRVSTTGWPHYYLVAFAVKNTPGFLLALLVAAFCLVARRGKGRAGAGEQGADGPELHWLLPAVITFTAASAGRIHIGERYILPVYPYLILLMASAGARLVSSARGRVVLAVVAALHVGPALAAAPDGTISYFNFLAGGRAGAHRVLVDSNLDWGQDLPRLAAWMKDHGVPSIQLGYHGSDEPGRFGIVHEDLPGLHLHPERPARRPFEGTVAVSPNLLLGIFYPPGQNPYARLLARPADDRAGVFFIYRLGAPQELLTNP
jgi:Dolichyl-phosphate-mannose-protein mannosyltransferase